METPLVTVIIPVYNSERFLSETLESLLKQSYGHWEALLVDDGSDDNSLNIASSFEKQDSRFHIIKRSREPKGPSVCRNIGIDVSKGDYIIFLDSDDLLHPDCLKGRVGFMESHPDLDFALFQGEAFGRKQFLLSEKRDNYLDAFLSFDFPWVVTSPLWRGSFLRDGERFDESLRNLEDPELHIRILKNEPNFQDLFEDEPDFFYRQHRVYTKEKQSGYLRFFEGYDHFFSKEELFEGLSVTQKKKMINGFYRVVSMILPPVTQKEYNLFFKMINSLNQLKVIGRIRYQLYLIFLKLVRRVNHKHVTLTLIYIWAFLIRPFTFVNQFVLPKLSGTRSAI